MQRRAFFNTSRSLVLLLRVEVKAEPDQGRIRSAEKTGAELISSITATRKSRWSSSAQGSDTTFSRSAHGIYARGIEARPIGAIARQRRLGTTPARWLHRLWGIQTSTSVRMDGVWPLWWSYRGRARIVTRLREGLGTSNCLRRDGRTDRVGTIVTARASKRGSRRSTPRLTTHLISGLGAVTFDDAATSPVYRSAHYLAAAGRAPAYSNGSSGLKGMVCSACSGPRREKTLFLDHSIRPGSGVFSGAQQLATRRFNVELLAGWRGRRQVVNYSRGRGSRRHVASSPALPSTADMPAMTGAQLVTRGVIGRR